LARTREGLAVANAKHPFTGSRAASIALKAHGVAEFARLQEWVATLLLLGDALGALDHASTVVVLGSGHGSAIIGDGRAEQIFAVVAEASRFLVLEAEALGAVFNAAVSRD